jgi:hypothetical protein
MQPATDYRSLSATDQLEYRHVAKTCRGCVSWIQGLLRGHEISGEVTNSGLSFVITIVVKMNLGVMTSPVFRRSQMPYVPPMDHKQKDQEAI